MKKGDLVRHIDDISDNKFLIGFVLGLPNWPSDDKVRVFFADSTYVESWPQDQLRVVEGPQ